MDKTLSEHNNPSEKESAVVTTVMRSLTPQKKKRLAYISVGFLLSLVGALTETDGLYLAGTIFIIIYLIETLADEFWGQQQ